MRFIRSLFFVSIIAALFGTVQAQSNAEITSPQAVSLVRGIVAVEGTASVPDQTGYFLQYREINEELTPIGGENALWAPVVTLQRGTVVNGVLGEWDTTQIEDGIYQLQLVVNRTGGNTVRATVLAVRVQNEQPAFDGSRFVGEPQAPARTATFTPVPVAFATTTPAAFTSAVTVTARLQANVRLGDSTSYPPVGVLEQGQSVQAIGRSSRSTWLFIRLPDGDEGFIADSTLNIDGDVLNLPAIEPPPLPFTRTPTPTPTFTPSPIVANLVIVDIDIDPDSPRCGETFRIEAVVQNIGTGPSNASGIIYAVDRETDDGEIQETTLGGFPILDAGQRFEAVIPMTVDDAFGEKHRIELVLDVNNSVAETNESDNFASREYDLREPDASFSDDDDDNDDCDN